MLPQQTQKLALDIEEKRKKKQDGIYIGKPSKGSQGYGIVLFDDIKDAPTKMHKNSNEYLV